MKIVGELLGSTEFPLSGLKPEDGWSLFSKYAFGGEKLEDHPDLEVIGKQIVENLGGSALAIKVIGGQLNANFGFEEWNRILKKDLSKPSDIMTILRLSYEHLPEHLQRCFAYCSLFPKDWNLDPGKIIDMWIAQGFVHREESDYTSDLENVAKDYFKELLSRSFLEQLERGDKIYYVMHDLMNDLALHVSEGECFRIEHEEFKLPSSVRHLSIANKKLDKLSFAKELEGLRTLIIFEDSVLCSKVILEGNMLEKFKSARVLDLSGCCLNRVPNTIDRLVHLRYLAMKGSSHPLPRSVYRLYHLQVLAILHHSCQNLGPFEFCKSIKDLTGLLHVDVAGAYAVILDGMHYLSCLRADGVLHVKKKRRSKLVELKDKIKCVNGIFHAENNCCKKLDDFKGKKKNASTEQSSSRLGELNDKNKLRGKLYIKSLENVKSLTEAAEAQLDCKEDITELELEYKWKEKSDMFKEQIDVLEALKPHHNLEKLVLKGSPRTKSPSWLETDWLSRVHIINLCNCYYWKSLPPLGQLPFLNDLKVAKNDSITQISTEFYGTGVFPSLVRLSFEELSELQEWLGFDGRQLFPKLQQLLISRCNKLSKIPPLPVALEYFSFSTWKPYVSKYATNFFLDFLHYVNDRSVPLRPLFGFKASSLVFLDFLHAHHLNSFQVLDIDFESNISMIGRALRLIKSQKFLKELRIRHVNSGCVELILAEHKDEWDDALPMSLHTLEIYFCEFTVGLISIWLQKLSSLNKLILYNCFGTYQGQTFTLPCFAMLEYIDISGGDQFISLPDLKNLPDLEKLVLRNYESPENTLTDSDSMQKLKELTINGCNNLEILSNVNDYPAQLEELNISGCRALKTLDNVGNSIRMRRLSLVRCDQITTLEGLQGLVSLSDMFIYNCPQLLSLPKMDRFYSFEILDVSVCPNLNSLPKTGFPVSLGKLVLVNCHPMMHKQFKKKKGREWNKVAAILLKGRCYYTVGEDKLLIKTRALYEREQQEQQERRHFTLKNCITFS
ncbi:hypothetical protein LUZ60_010721 [Juncus effusus]|nr:hypothetical protein LUZ60_010721 [Juncus effusus]